MYTYELNTLKAVKHVRGKTPYADLPGFRVGTCFIRFCSQSTLAIPVYSYDNLEHGA